MNKQNFNSTVWARLVKFNKNFFRRGDTVLAGVSGGADSVALLHFLKYLSGKNGFELNVCHVNHSLRAAAARDAAFTKKLCKELDVPCFIKKVNVKQIAKTKRMSLEHAARYARYSAFEEIAKKTGAETLALAHHLDDHAETILLNLLRGTKAKGLLGIPLQRPLNKKTCILRPFLCITREEVMAYIKFNKLSYVTDETNSDDAYLRNWIRQKLLPMMEKKQPKVREHLFMFSEDLAKYIKE